jgi:hypothetical protein
MTGLIDIFLTFAYELDIFEGDNMNRSNLIDMLSKETGLTNIKAE